MAPQNPLEKGLKPPFPEQQQEVPGLESEMNPKPDYGENSYKGSGKLSLCKSERSAKVVAAGGND